MRRKFVISSLLAVGLVPSMAQASLPIETNDDSIVKKPTLFEKFRLEHKYTLAAHRSHGSHGSHGSHRSSSGGGIAVPRPPSGGGTPLLSAPPSVRSNSTPPSSVLPESPATAPVPLPGNSNKFQEILKEVQLRLSIYGYYTGTLDGTFGPETQAALSKFQQEWNLPITGTVTPEVLDAMGIQAK